MSLNFELGKIKDFKKVCYGEEGGRMNGRTHSLIWGLMFIDISAITETNAPEVFARLDLYARAFGAPLCRDNNGVREDVFLTPADVRAHIGLETNVSTKGRAFFLKKLGRALDERAERYQEETKPENVPA